jgi:putative restriction endonuclease
MKGIFDARLGSRYDDDSESRYHFPNNYLEEARKLVGDWIIYRSTRRGGGKIAYFATAKVTAVEPDPARADHSYARVAEFLPFDVLVPLEKAGGFYERQLNFVAKNLRGVAFHGRSMRTISEPEFAEIVHAGLKETLAPDNAVRLELDGANTDAETFALVNAPEEEQERKIVQILLNRKVRDANFRRQVCEAYDNTCAVTKLQLVNGGGKAEAQAAHIWPVANGGPDVVQNGLALSATVRWLFDRHLISLTDEYGLLVAHNRVPSELRSLFQNQLQQIHLPENKAYWPRIRYIQRHRAAFVG